MSFSVEELITILLKQLKKQAEFSLQQTINHAIITVPACWPHCERQIIRAAAHKADLIVDRIINEPTAIALSYGLDIQVPE